MSARANRKRRKEMGGGCPTSPCQPHSLHTTRGHEHHSCLSHGQHSISIHPNGSQQPSPSSTRCHPRSRSPSPWLPHSPPWLPLPSPSTSPLPELSSRRLLPSSRHQLWVGMLLLFLWFLSCDRWCSYGAAEDCLPWGVAGGGQEVGGRPPERQRPAEAAAGEREDRRQEHRGGGREAAWLSLGPEARWWRRHHCKPSLHFRFHCFLCLFFLFFFLLFHRKGFHRFILLIIKSSWQLSSSESNRKRP